MVEWVEGVSALLPYCVQTPLRIVGCMEGVSTLLPYCVQTHPQNGGICGGNQYTAALLCADPLRMARQVEELVPSLMCCT